MSIFAPDANKGQSRELLPKGALVWVQIHPKEIKNSSNTGGEMVVLELTVIAGQFNNRKIFVNIANVFDQRNSPDYRSMGAVHFQRIFEGTGIFQPQHPQSYLQFEGKDVQAVIDALLNKGSQCVTAVRVLVSKGKDGYEDKNDVEFLSPNVHSNSAKDWKKLMDSGAAQEVIPAATAAPQVPNAVPGVFTGSPAAVAGVPVAAPVATSVGAAAPGVYASPQALTAGQPPIAPPTVGGAVPTGVPVAATGVPPWVAAGNVQK